MVVKRFVVALDAGPPVPSPLAETSRLVAQRSFHIAWGQFIADVQCLGRRLEASLEDQFAVLQEQVAHPRPAQPQPANPRQAVNGHVLKSAASMPNLGGYGILLSKPAPSVRVAEAEDVITYAVTGDAAAQAEQRGDPDFPKVQMGSSDTIASTPSFGDSIGKIGKGATRDLSLSDTDSKDNAGPSQAPCVEHEGSDQSHLTPPAVPTRSSGRSSGGPLHRFETRHICSSVDADLLPGRNGVVRSILHKYVSSQGFETFLACVILLNCGTIGLQAHELAADSLGPLVNQVLDISEHVFTAIFTMELLVRLYIYGCKAYIPTDSDKRFNFLDGVLVIVTGVLSSWVVPLAALASGKSNRTDELRSLQVLRMVRLGRLVRVFRRLAFFREAWILIRGLRDSMRTLFWTCMVIFFLTYAFAVFGAVIVVPQLKSVLEHVTDQQDIDKIEKLLEYVGGLDRLMFTLIQVCTMDGYAEIIRGMMQYVEWVWLYFYAYIAISHLSLMNLITAVIVENAMAYSVLDQDQTVQEREKRKKRELNDLRHLFGLMDVDQSGTICWEEFRAAFEDPEISKKWKVLDFEPEECKELFNLLDDGDGEIEADEFFDGLSRMKGGAQSKDLYRLQTSINKLQHHFEELRVSWKRTGWDSEGSMVGNCGSFSFGTSPDCIGRPPPPRRPSSKELAAAAAAAVGGTAGDARPLAVATRMPSYPSSIMAVLGSEQCPRALSDEGLPPADALGAVGHATGRPQASAVSPRGGCGVIAEGQEPAEGGAQRSSSPGPMDAVRSSSAHHLGGAQPCGAAGAIGAAGGADGIAGLQPQYLAGGLTNGHSLVTSAESSPRRCGSSPL